MHLSTAVALLLAAAQSSLAQGTTIVVSAAPAPTSASYTKDSTFEDDMVKAHNFYRKAHNASDLEWNDTSAKTAADWADGCVFKHSGGPTGENLAVGYPNATSSVDAWALEREDYNWKKPGFDEKTGHFTQLVWRNTTSVGCGRADCDGKKDIQGWLVVCEYYPAGNVIFSGDEGRLFKDNVLAQTEGKPSDTVESGVSSGTDSGAKSAATGWNDARWGCGVLVAAGVTVFGIVW